MAIPNCSHNVVLVIFMLIVFTTMNMEEALGKRPESRNIVSRCWGITKYILYCFPYISSIPPYNLDLSDRCCNQVKKTDILLFCKKFMKEHDNIYNSNRVVNIARVCGNPLPKGTQCGSKFYACYTL